MTAQQERSPALKPLKTPEEILSELPHAVELAKIEAETSGLTKTPEGKYVLSFLLSARNLLRPILTDTHIHRDLMTQIGGQGYNPQRNIDELGILIANYLNQQTTDIPNMWIRSEEHARWEPVNPAGGLWDDAERFVFLDPVDETGAIPKGKRYQAAGVAIYKKSGELCSLGVVSLVDDGMIFIDTPDHVTAYANTSFDRDGSEPAADRPIRVATLSRRMHALRNTPILKHTGAWIMDSIGGYAVLSLLNNSIDTIIDPIKGNPWYEYVLWGPAAEAVGMTVTDPNGNPIDYTRIVRDVIAKNPDDAYRIPFVMSKTPEIHARVLASLTPNTEK